MTESLSLSPLGHMSHVTHTHTHTHTQDFFAKKQTHTYHPVKHV